MTSRNANVTKDILLSLIQNPVEIELATFILNSGYSIRDYYLYREISELLRLEWQNVEPEK